MKFQLNSPFKPSGDQPEAIMELTKGLVEGRENQVLLGVTGSGKTFTVANVIEKVQKPALVISHNKTLAAQLYQEFKSFFPKNAVSYFVSYYDYYQPEAYIPHTDTYIEKETEINEEIDKLRLAATTNLLTRSDTIIVASVSCIYNIGSPKEYGSFILELKQGVKVTRESILSRLVELQYNRSDFGFHRGTFRVRGENIDIFPAYEDSGLRIVHDGQRVEAMSKIDAISGSLIEKLTSLVLYPAKHYMTDVSRLDVFENIEKDLELQVVKFKKENKLLEAHRIGQKVRYDIEMIQELGYVNGIENYSRYFDGRNPGDPPYTLFDYYQEKYGNDWLLVIDESHMTIPQIRGMYNGDRSRKEVLVDFGFRLPAAMDNRPLKFEEFLRRIPLTIFVSATPSEWEISCAIESAREQRTKNKELRTIKNSELRTKNQEQRQKVLSSRSLVQGSSGIVEQLVRPTGLVDPEVEIRPSKGQIADLINEIEKRVERKERVLVTTLTKRMAEDLSKYLQDRAIKVHYLHADLETLERSDILDDLRLGKYDVIVGINLLREGLDLPEVSLVAILDADKEGFLRSQVSLIQTMGRAARHVSSQVIMYADEITGSMERAIAEVTRRRKYQIEYNRKHRITPHSISKPIREKLVEGEIESDDPVFGKRKKAKTVLDRLLVKEESLTPFDRKRLIKKLEREMRIEANNLNFELAAQIRDKVRELKSNVLN